MALLKKDYQKTFKEQLQQLRTAQKQLLLFQEQDSLYRILDEKMQLRYEAGEVAKLDQILVHSKAARAKSQLAQQQQIVNACWVQLKNLMAYTGPDFELADAQTFDINHLPINGSNTTHPALDQYLKAAQKTRLDISLNKAQQIPQLALGYFNQTLVGTQNLNGQDVYFGPQSRFQGALVQTQIPIDFRAAKQRQAALQLQLDQYAFQYNQQQFEMQQRKNQLYTQLLEMVSSYQSLSVPIIQELDQLQADAVLQFESGEISLIDLIQLQDHKLALENELLQWQHDLNMIYIQFNWYSNEN